MRRNGKRSDSRKERWKEQLSLLKCIFGGVENQEQMTIEDICSRKGWVPMESGWVRGSEMFAWGRTGVLRELGQQITLGSWICFFTSPRGLHVPHAPLTGYSSTSPATSHSPPHLSEPLGWKAAGQLSSPAPWEPSHHRTGRASWKTKGEIGAHEANVSLQSLLWPVQQKQILPGCVLWTSRVWVMLWKPQAQAPVKTSPCREEAEKKSSDYQKMCCAQCSAVPSPLLAPGCLPSIHPPKYWSPINGDCRQHMK